MADGAVAIVGGRGGADHWSRYRARKRSLIENGRISAVGESVAVPDGAQVVDAAGRVGFCLVSSMHTRTSE